MTTSFEESISASCAETEGAEVKEVVVKAKVKGEGMANFLVRNRSFLLNTANEKDIFS